MKSNLTEVKKKLEAIEERFVIGEIDRNLYDKFRPKYEKECFEIEQELNKSDGYFSNLKKVIDFAVKVCRNPLIMCNDLDFGGKRVFQNLLFPEGIIYNREFDQYRTSRVNSFFSAIPQLKRIMEQNKSGNFVDFDKTSASVHPSGEISNFLVEDFEAISKFMSTDAQKKAQILIRKNKGSDFR